MPQTLSEFVEAKTKPPAQPAERTWSFYSQGRHMVSICMDTGTVTFGESYNPDEVARMFWQDMAARAPNRV